MEEQLLEEALRESMDDCFEDFNDLYEHELETTRVPYGDTSVKLHSYPTEESLIKCEECFKQDFDIDKYVKEHLLENDKFREFIKNYLHKEYFN